MDIVQMVLAGKINKELVALISRAGGNALGLCGIDGGMIKAKRLLEDGVDYGLVGDICSIDPKPIYAAIEHGYIPVISSVAAGIDADTGYNVNADTAAAKLAVALGAEKLILLTDVRGLLRDPKDESTLIPVAGVNEIPELTKEGIISGGMIPKIDCCVTAIRSGVKRTHILDGRIPHSILIEMLSDAGIGTMID
jgi:acetylglutamate kinase